MGAYESVDAQYWPSHVSPILVELDGQGLWRRWDYVCTRRAGFELVAPIGDFTEPTESSFRHGAYLACEPQQFLPHSQLLAVKPGRLVVAHTTRAALAVLLRQVRDYRSSPQVARSAMNAMGLGATRQRQRRRG